MTLIKMYFVTIVRRLTSEVAEKMAGKVLAPVEIVNRHYADVLHSAQELSENALTALLYTKFSNTSETLRILIFELEKRGRLEPDEYGSLLQECYATWFASRTSLLSAPLAEEVRRMDPGSTELIQLVRSDSPRVSFRETHLAHLHRHEQAATTFVQCR